MNFSDGRDIKVQVVNQGTEKGRLLSPVDKGYTEPRGPISLRLPLLPRKRWRKTRSFRQKERMKFPSDVLHRPLAAELQYYSIE